MVNIECYYTEHFINQTVVQFFSKGLGLPLFEIEKYIETDKFFASYGILRGTGEIIKQRKKNLYTLIMVILIHPQENLLKKKTILNSLDGYFRVIKDDLYFNSQSILKEEKKDLII